MELADVFDASDAALAAELARIAAALPHVEDAAERTRCGVAPMRVRASQR
jgi:hypothetical protein